MEQIHVTEWIDRCSKQLQDYWHTVDPEQLDEVAIDLWHEARWRTLPPEAAALQWLQLGVLAS